MEFPNPIPVAIFDRATVRGGAEEHILALLHGFDRKSFRLHMVCPAELALRLTADLPEDVALFPIDRRGPGEWLALARFLRRERIGILHSHQFFSSRLASPLGRMLGVPVILETPHINEAWRRGWKACFFADRLVGRCVDYHIAVSEANARYLTGTKKLPAAKVRVIRNGCDLRRFEVSRASGTLKTELGFSAADPLLLVIGRLAPQKGHGVMLQAMAKLLPEFPNLKLICVGEGELRSALQEQARTLRVHEAVRFIGYQPNIPEWLPTADLVVLPSLFEGLPLVAVEALAARRPIVATAVDGSPEVVIDGRTGVTVPPGDPVALAAAIATLLRDPQRAAFLADAGHAWVAEHFSLERQVQQTQELYLRVWKERVRQPQEVPVEAESACAGRTP